MSSVTPAPSSSFASPASKAEAPSSPVRAARFAAASRAFALSFSRYANSEFSTIGRKSSNSSSFSAWRTSAAVTVERLDSFARSLAIVVTYIMKIEHAFEKAVFASLPICTPSGSFALMIRMIAATGSDISSGTGVSSSAGRSLRLAPTPTVDSLVTSAWSDDDPPSGMFGAEAADALYFLGIPTLL